MKPLKVLFILMVCLSSAGCTALWDATVQQNKMYLHHLNVSSDMPGLAQSISESQQKKYQKLKCINGRRGLVTTDAEEKPADAAEKNTRFTLDIKCVKQHP